MIASAPPKETGFNLARQGWLQRFVDVSVERMFSEEQRRVGMISLRHGLKLFLAVCIAALAFQLGVLRLTWGHPMTRFMLCSVLAYGLTLVVALRAAPNLHRMLGWWVVAVAGASIAIASPMLLLRGYPMELLLRYGYFGLVLFALLPFLILRLPWLDGVVANLATIAAYAMILYAIPDFPPLHRWVHLHNVLIGLGAAASGGWMLEKLARDEFVQRLTVEARERELQAAHVRIRTLLLNTLPESIANRLQAGEHPLADGPLTVSVVFADIVGFTPLAARLPPAKLVLLLDQLFRRFDLLAATFGVEKIKTIGDAYLAVAGVPQSRPDHACAAADFALSLLEATREIARESNLPLDVRIGIDTGKVIAGVIGRDKFAYDVWGETVNTAARMESHGEPGRVQISEATRLALGDDFLIELRGPREIKGLGTMNTFWVVARKSHSIGLAAVDSAGS